MPTTYSDQFYAMDPGVPPPAGTALTVQVFNFVDNNDNGFIEAGTDTVNGSAVVNVWVDDTITVTVGGSPVTITGTTFYTADGGRYFTPNDGSVLVDSVFQSSTFVNTSTQMPVSDFGPPCFTRGTKISTLSGEVPVEDLTVGDMVETLDHGLQPIRWIGCSQTNARGDHAPVVFKPGAIGNEVELKVSPQHRILVHGWQAELYFGEAEVLIPAKHLLNGLDIVQEPANKVEYFHILFDRHEVVTANGVLSESFFPGDQILLQDRAIRAELLALFPELENRLDFEKTARATVKCREAQVLQQVA